MTKPAILDAIDEALKEKYPAGLMVAADGSVLSDVIDYLDAEQDVRFAVYRDVMIRRSLAQMPGGFMIRQMPGHDRRDDETGQYQPDQP